MKNIIVVLLIGILFACQQVENKITPIRVVTDLNIGEKKEIELSNGEIVTIELISMKDSVDKVDSAVRSAQAEVLVNGEHAVLDVSNYNLPVVVGGVQVDCPVTKAYKMKSRHERWKLEKDARFRLWPQGSPLLKTGTFAYPLKQRIFASDTQMGNDPVYVNGGEEPGVETIYYHSGLDFGGFEGMDEVISPVDGIVIVAGENVFEGYKDKLTGDYRYDEAWIEDGRGWQHGFFHLYSIDSTFKPGMRIKMGQPIGLMGKEGGAGGWCHLHYTVKTTQPSGLRGEEDAYAYVWEAYVNQNKPKIIAVARPHVFVSTSDKVTLDGNKSKSFEGEITSYEWIFYDGTIATGIKQERSYVTPGTYSEVLKVTDSEGNIDYDYTVVQVVNMEDPEKLPPSMHAVYYPTMGIKVNDPITFGVRTFRTSSGDEGWDFGDGSPKVVTKSEIPEKKREGEYAKVVHQYKEPGNYLVSVERTDENGFKATAHLHVEVK